MLDISTEVRTRTSTDAENVKIGNGKLLYGIILYIFCLFKCYEDFPQLNIFPMTILYKKIFTGVALISYNGTKHLDDFIDKTKKIMPNTNAQSFS